MACLRRKDERNDVKPTVSTTFEKPVVDLNVLQKEMATICFIRQIFGKNQNGKWNNSTKWRKNWEKAIALTVQNDSVNNGSCQYSFVA